MIAARAITGGCTGGAGTSRTAIGHECATMTERDGVGISTGITRGITIGIIFDIIMGTTAGREEIAVPE